MRSFQVLAGVALLATAFAACDDNSNIGTSVISDEINILVDSTQVVSVEQSDRVTSIQSRTINQLLGIIDSKDFGLMKSDILTQFMPANSIDTKNVTLEGLTLTFFVANGSYVGDSVIPMGLNVYTLDAPLPTPIYSNEDPSKFYNPDNLIASTVYNLAGLGVSDSIMELSYRAIDVDLPLSLGNKLLDEYKRNPQTFATPGAFAKFFPGLYIENTFGSGRLVNIGQTVMTMHYAQDTSYTNKAGELRDTVWHKSANYFAVTPEIITNNNISFTPAQSIADRIAAGEKILLAPLGYDVSFNFPIKQLLEQYRKNSGLLSVVNTLTFSIPAATIPNTFGIEPPETVLMVLTDKYKEFIEKNSLPDNETSFLATYNDTTDSYDFAGMRPYFLYMLEKEEIEEKDYNFTLSPVTANYESNSSSSYYYYGTSSQQTLTAIVPYVEQPAMTKLDFSKAKIKLTYSKQSTSF